MHEKTQAPDMSGDTLRAAAREYADHALQLLSRHNQAPVVNLVVYDRDEDYLSTHTSKGTLTSASSHREFSQLVADKLISSGYLVYLIPFDRTDYDQWRNRHEITDDSAGIRADWAAGQKT